MDKLTDTPKNPVPEIRYAHYSPLSWSIFSPVYSTREEAEKALARRSNAAPKTQVVEMVIDEP